jgi:hypothetical protein
VAYVLAGCGGSGGDSPPPGASGTTRPKVYTREQLPALEDYLPPQDEGRVEVAGPRGWNVMSRREEYVARFAEKSGSAPPRILITAEPAPGGNPGNVTADNLDQFKAFIEPIVRKGLLQGEELREPVRMVILGEQPWARYIRGGKFKTMDIDRQFLKTIAGGRIYTVELQIFRGNLMDHRDIAYAVAAGMRFLKTDAAGGTGGEGSLGDLLGGADEGGGEEGADENNGKQPEEGEGDETDE